jgi:hypothetical protein
MSKGRIKTYEQDALEKFPNAIRNKQGTLKICRGDLYGFVCPKEEYKDSWNYKNGNMCKECWNIVYVERG